MPVKGTTAITRHAQRMRIAAFGSVTADPIARLERLRKIKGVSMDAYLRTLVVCAERLGL